MHLDWVSIHLDRLPPPALSLGGLRLARAKAAKFIEKENTKL